MVDQMLRTPLASFPLGRRGRVDLIEEAGDCSDRLRFALELNGLPLGMGDVARPGVLEPCAGYAQKHGLAPAHVGRLSFLRPEAAAWSVAGRPLWLHCTKVQLVWLACRGVAEMRCYVPALDPMGEVCRHLWAGARLVCPSLPAPHPGAEPIAVVSYGVAESLERLLRPVGRAGGLSAGVVGPRGCEAG